MRTEHAFEFTARQIADAARREAEYHEGRLVYWRDEFDSSARRVQETATIKVDKREVTGGYGVTVVPDYGDVAAYHRLNEADQKLRTHRADAERFRSEEKVYMTQGDRLYDLSLEDVHYFRLGGRGRTE